MDPQKRGFFVVASQKKGLEFNDFLCSFTLFSCSFAGKIYRYSVLTVFFCTGQWTNRKNRPQRELGSKQSRGEDLSKEIQQIQQAMAEADSRISITPGLSNEEVSD